MGHISIVYGYIYGMGTNAKENAERIAALPEHDTRPYLTRDMFAVPSMEHSYEDQLITFGLVYNRVELWWDAWLKKVEALLRTMYWDEAHVYLQTDLWGSYHYQSPTASSSRRLALTLWAHVIQGQGLGAG